MTGEKQEQATQIAVEWSRWEARRQELGEERRSAQSRLREARAREREQRARVDELLLGMDLPSLSLAYAIRREMGEPMQFKELRKLRRQIYDVRDRARRRRSGS